MKFATLLLSLCVAASAQEAAVQKACQHKGADCANAVAHAIVGHSKLCFDKNSEDEPGYKTCTENFCDKECGLGQHECVSFCDEHAMPLYAKFSAKASEEAPKPVKAASLLAEAREAAGEEASAMGELQEAQAHMRRLNARIATRAEVNIKKGNVEQGQAALAKVAFLNNLNDQVDKHLSNVAHMKTEAEGGAKDEAPSPSFLQRAQVHLHKNKAPEDELAKEMTHDLEMNFNKIAPFGKEDTAKELQDHAAKTQDTLVDAVENAEVAEIKRAVFRALTRLRAATIKEFDTIARLETQAIDAYNDAHHYRGENPLAHLHEDEAPVETDKLKSFH